MGGRQGRQADFDRAGGPGRSATERTVGWGFLAPALDLRRARTLTLRSLGRSYRRLLVQFPTALWEATEAAFTKLWIVPFGIVLGISVMWFGVFAAIARLLFGDNPAGSFG
jgi:hypothetical protein